MNGVKIILNHFSLEGASCKTKLQAILSKYKMFLKLCMILALAWSRNPPSPLLRVNWAICASIVIV